MTVVKKENVTCPDCNGSGSHIQKIPSGFSDPDFGNEENGCRNCGGAGTKGKKPAGKWDDPYKKGSGKVTVTYTKTGLSCGQCGGNGKVEVCPPGQLFMGPKKFRIETCSICLGTGERLKKETRPKTGWF